MHYSYLIKRVNRKIYIEFKLNDPLYIFRYATRYNYNHWTKKIISWSIIVCDNYWLKTVFIIAVPGIDMAPPGLFVGLLLSVMITDWNYLHLRGSWNWSDAAIIIYIDILLCHFIIYIIYIMSVYNILKIHKLCRPLPCFR